MITKLWSISLLVSQIAHGFDHSIDLSRCQESACFIRESCLKDKSDDKKLVEYKKEDLKVDGVCDVVLQMKSLGRKMFHVMMQVKGTKLKHDSLELYQQERQFKCKQGGNEGKYKIKDEGAQVFSDERIFCSFTVDLTPDFVSVLNGNVNAKPDIRFSNNDANVKVEYGESQEDMWGHMGSDGCENSQVSSSDDAKDDGSSEMTLSETNTFYPPIKCSNGKLVLKDDSSRVEDVSQISCTNKKWEKEVSGTKTLLTGPLHTVYCREKRCRKCLVPPPAPTCPDCKAPPVLTPPATEDDCPTLKCTSTNGKWTATGTTIISGNATCARATTNPAGYAWFLGGTELTHAGCLETINCSSRFKTENYPGIAPDTLKTCTEEPNSPKCHMKGIGTNRYSCKSTYDFKLKTGLEDKASDVMITDDLLCNTTNGRFYSKKKPDVAFTHIECIPTSATPKPEVAQSWQYTHKWYFVSVGCVIIVVLSIWVSFRFRRHWRDFKEDRAAAKALQELAEKVDKKSGGGSSSQMGSVQTPLKESSEGKKSKSRKSKRESKKSKRESKKSKRDSKAKESKKEESKKFKLENFESWTNEQFLKEILPNFKKCDPDSQRNWVRAWLGRFYAYCNPKKVLVGSTMLSLLDSRVPTPESGTFQQFWLFVKQCMDDNCDNGGVWRELWRIAFSMSFSVNTKSDDNDEFRLLSLKPFEGYMVEYFKKCDIFMRKNEPKSETEMRIICIEILLNVRHQDVIEPLRKLSFTEKIEVPLRMLIAACYARERDSKPSDVHREYLRVRDTQVMDPHVSEGWGTYLQHCLFGLGGNIITVTEAYQKLLFPAIYQADDQKSTEKRRDFSPTDWLFAYKGALMHENSAAIAMEMFKRYNEHSLLHIESLLKQRYKTDDDAEEREKKREEIMKSMKEYTLLLADLLVGEEEFNEFRAHLRFVILFVGEWAKKGEPLDEERIRERAINFGNMVRDPNFSKESNESLKAIGMSVAK